MLGGFSKTETGYYENVEKIMAVALGFVTAFGNVMLPRMSNMVARQEVIGVRQTIATSMRFVLGVSCALTFGMIAVAPDFVDLYFGDGFEPCVKVMIALAPTMIFQSWANVIRTQYLIPFKYDNVYVGSVVFGAVVNFTINYLMIPRWGALGAVAGTIVAEASVAIIQTFAVRSKLEIPLYLKRGAPFFIFGIVILAVTQFSWTGGLLDGLTGGLRTACIGVCFFLMGGYIARYNPFRNVRLYTIFLVIFATYAIRFLSAHNMIYKAIDDYWKSNSEGNFIQMVQGYANHEITVVILVVCFFELFRRWNIPYSKIINFIGKSTLMIYFIHENVFFRSFYRNDSWMETLGESWGAYCIKWLQWTALGFVLGLLAYAIFTALGRLLPKMRILFVRQNVD